MIRRLSKGESGYSLVEVMVAIMILAIAIIPMVGMFDAGLRAAVLGGDYDRARAIAGEELEEIRTLPYNTPPNPPADSVVEIYPPGGAVACTGPIEAGFSCQVQTAYARMDSAAIVSDPDARTMIQATVTVTWGGGNSYSTTGLVSKGTT